MMARFVMLCFIMFLPFVPQAKAKDNLLLAVNLAPGGTRPAQSTCTPGSCEGAKVCAVAVPAEAIYTESARNILRVEPPMRHHRSRHLALF
ncbi:MAG: hypothetical protein HQK52_23050 [Oligoflexia bacterium]|nr:hypothetical protein [Oligoflexia bacterium]